MERENNHQREPKNLEFDVPDRLVRGLCSLRSQQIFVPRTIDESILQRARQQFSRPAKGKSWWPLLIPSFGLAVALLLGAALWHRNPGGTPAAEFSGEDINHDGRVDILDAFALARELQKKGSVGVHTDFHGDGVVDDRDVELIAIHAVSLGKRGKS